MKKQLPKSIHDYLNPSHLGQSKLFSKIIEDSEGFTLTELQEICSSTDIDYLIRATALFMLGSKWDLKSLDYVYKLLTKNPTLCEYADDLFTTYASPEAKKTVMKLLEQSLITNSKAAFLIELIDDNIKYNKDPVKLYGMAKYKE